MLVTGYVSLDSVNTLVGLADAYLPKPFHVRELREKVELAGRRTGRGAAPEPDPAVGAVTRRALVLEPDVRACARLTRLLRAMGVAVELALSSEELEGPTPLHGAVISAGALEPAVRKAVWRRQGANPDFRLVVTSAARTVDDGILAIGAGACAHLVLADGDGALSYALGQALGISPASVSGG